MNTRYHKLIVFSVAGTLLTGAALAHDHGGDSDWPDHLGLDVNDQNQIITGGNLDRNDDVWDSWGDQRVFGQHFGHEDNADDVVDWGTQSRNTTFTWPSSIGLNFRDALHRWDGSDFVSLNPASEERLRMVASPHVVDTSTGFVEGPATPVRDPNNHSSDVGRHHDHFVFQILGDDIRDGIYLLELEAYQTSEDETVMLAENSDPFWFVFAKDQSDHDLEEAVDYVQTHIVPEPASLALLGLGGVALLARRRRASA